MFSDTECLNGVLIMNFRLPVDWVDFKLGLADCPDKEKFEAEYGKVYRIYPTRTSDTLEINSGQFLFHTDRGLWAFDVFTKGETLRPKDPLLLTKSQVHDVRVMNTFFWYTTVEDGFWKTSLYDKHRRRLIMNVGSEVPPQVFVSHSDRINLVIQTQDEIRIYPETSTPGTSCSTIHRTESIHVEEYDTTTIHIVDDHSGVIMRIE